MFVAGLGLFTVASVAVGTAQSEAWLIAARAVQGIGAAVLAPSTLALLQTSFPEGPERTRAVAYYAAVAGVAATVGLVVDGIFAGWLSWRVGFFINAPIGIAMMLAAPRLLPETEPRPGRLDAAGAISSTFGMTALVYGIVRSADAGWADPVTLAPVRQCGCAHRGPRDLRARHGVAEPPLRRHRLPHRRRAADDPDRRRPGPRPRAAHGRRHRGRGTRGRRAAGGVTSPTSSAAPWASASSSPSSPRRARARCTARSCWRIASRRR
jgi:hypothetical protein